MSAGRQINLISGTLAVLVFVVLSFLGLEMGARLMDDVPLGKLENFIDVDLRRTFNGGANDYDPLLGWVLAPNRKSGTPEFSLTTGKYGLRMHQFEIVEPESGGILVVGDSFVAGSEVSDSDTWPAQLESMLGKPVYNAGVGAYGVDQIVLRAERLLDELRPKVLIVSPLADDSLRNTYRRYGAQKPYFDIVDGTLELKNVPVPVEALGHQDLGFARSILGYSYLMHKAAIQFGYYNVWVSHSLDYQQVHENAIGTKISCLLIQRLVKVRDDRGIRVIFMVQYGGQDSINFEPAWYGREVVECARGAGLQTIDTHPPLHAVAEKGIEDLQRLYVMHDENRVYGHMSAAGNRFIAEIVQSALAMSTASN